MSPEEFINTYLMGNGVTVVPGSATFNGTTVPINANPALTANQIGTFFTDGSAFNKLQLSGGIILCSGNVLNAATSSQGCFPPSTCPVASTSTGSGNDPDLNVLMQPATSNDKAILEFDFIPQTDIVSFRFVFASEEFDQYCNQYNDAFGFLISGPGCGTTPPNIFSNNAENIALLPNTTDYVTINNICANKPLYSWCNLTDLSCQSGSGPEFSYNRFTYVFTASKVVVACSTYHMKICIGDAGDSAYDSGVFLEQNSFSSNNITFNNIYSFPDLGDFGVEGCSNAIVTFQLAQPALVDVTIDFTLGGTAIPDGPGVPNPDYGITPIPTGTPFPTSITIPAGQSSADITIYPYMDSDYLEPDETVTFTVFVITCDETNSSTNTITIKNNTPFSVAISSPSTVCEGESVTLTAVPSGGQPIYTYLWNNGSTNNPETVNPPLGSNTYSLIATDGCTETSSASTVVQVNPLPPDPIISGPTVVCEGVTCQYTTQPGMTSYDWTGTTGTIINGGTSTDNFIEVVWDNVNPQLVRVTYSSALDCSALNSGELTITVATFETPIISGVPEICPGVNTTFTTQSGMQNYLWSYPGAVLVRGGGLTDDFIELKWPLPGPTSISANFTNSDGCTATSPTEFNVTVNPIPNVVPATPSPVIICSGTNAQVALSSSVPGTEAITTFAWTASGNATTVTPDPSTISGSGDILQNLANAGNIAEPVVFHILPTAAGCSPNVPADFTFNVNPVPVTQSSPGSQQIICSATSTLPITLQTNVLGLSPTYAWTSLCDPLITNCPPTSGNSNPVASFTPGNPTLSQKTITFSIVASLTATTGVCPGPELVYTILVNPLPISTFTSSTPSPVCQDFPTPSFYTVDPGGPASTYSWVVTPPANAVIADPTANPASITWKLAGSSPQNALLTLTAVTSGPDPVCTTNSSASVTINPKPPAQLTPCFELVTNRSAKRFLLKGGTPLLTSTPLQGEYLSDPSTTALSSDASGNFYFNPALVTGTNTRTFDITYRYTSSQYGCIATSPSATLTVMAANPPCSGSMTDVRDGTVYTTALLPDGRCWMTKNLRYGTPLSPSTVPQTDNCTVEKYCLSSDPACTANGGFYQWDELIQFGNTDGPAYQGVCPPGWHIPTQQEWQSLINSMAGFTPGDGVAGGYLKDQNQANGFRALLKGMYYLNNTWAFISGNSLTATMFWTSTPSGSNRAIARGMNNYNYSVSFYPSSRTNAFTVRCVKD